MKEKQYKGDKKKRANTLPFCSALKIFGINVDNVAMILNLFYDVVFSKQTCLSKQTHIYSLHINSHAYLEELEL